MTHEADEQRDRLLDVALARLPTVDVEPLTSRVVYQAAERRLLQGREPLDARPASRLERFEPALLIAIGSVHLVWAVGRVLSAL